jgi:hypothetical protein
MFDGLHEAFGLPEQKIMPPDSFFNDKINKVDKDLSDLWKTDGWAAYQNSLFWTVNPLDFDDVADDWKMIKPKSLIFGRNAFGELFILHKDEVYVLSIQYNQLMNLGPSSYIFLNSTIKETDFKNVFLKIKLFNKLQKTLGNFAGDECYGLFPSVPFGGDEDDFKAYKIVKLKEYLSLLSQNFN